MEDVALNVHSMRQNCSIHLLVEMSNSAYSDQFSRAGIYKLQVDTINGKPYWIKNNNASALWFDGTSVRWYFGSVDDLGKTRGGLKSGKNNDSCVELPNMQWEFFDGNVWMAAGEDVWITPLKNGLSSSKNILSSLLNV